MKEEKRVYSNGLTFYYAARMREIPCDQLASLPRHKERSISVPERRNAVVRALHAIGGWVRMNDHFKQRRHVLPGTPCPAKNTKPNKQQKKNKNKKTFILLFILS